MSPDMYIDRVCRRQETDGPLAGRAAEAAFSQARGLLEAHPEYEKNAVLERLSRPERFYGFTAAWTDDNGRTRVSRGWRAESGPGEGVTAGLCFRGGLTADETEALAFYALLEKSLCRPGEGIVLCGGDCGPALFSDGESMRFCRSFAEGLFRWGPPPGAFAPLSPYVSDRELGYLSGRREALWGRFCPASGPASAAARQKAAGYGLCCFAQAALGLARRGRLDGKTVAVSGGGALASCVREMAARMGGQVTAVWDREGPAPAADVYFLCGREKPLDAAGAEALLARRPDGVFEGVSMACAPEAAERLIRAGVMLAPAIAAGSGGVMTEPGAAVSPPGERALRAAMEALCRRVWETGGGNMYAGAYTAAIEAAAETLLRRGI